MAQFIGWDIGGAHLKVASVDHDGAVCEVYQLATPLWQGLDTLKRALEKLRDQIKYDETIHSVTMTAELADIFNNRASGVYQVNECLAAYFGDQSYDVYAGESHLISRYEVSQHLHEIASANWHATGCFVAQSIDDGILIDVGSTTTDLLPLSGGQLDAMGYTDHQRLRHNELVYTGVIRTPVMAIVDKLCYQGQWQNIAAEHFATTADVYRLLGEFDERDDLMATSDGAGKDIDGSARRLFRMLGLDYRPECDCHDAKDIAGYIAKRQFKKIDAALTALLSRGRANHRKMCLVGAGAGCFLVRKLAHKHQLPMRYFSDFLQGDSEWQAMHNHRILSAATAVSVAQLARLKACRSN